MNSIRFSMPKSVNALLRMRVLTVDGASEITVRCIGACWSCRFDRIDASALHSFGHINSFELLQVSQARQSLLDLLVGIGLRR